MANKKTISERSINVRLPLEYAIMFEFIKMGGTDSETVRALIKEDYKRNKK